MDTQYKEASRLQQKNLGSIKQDVECDRNLSVGHCPDKISARHLSTVVGDADNFIQIALNYIQQAMAKLLAIDDY